MGQKIASVILMRNFIPTKVNFNFLQKIVTLESPRDFLFCQRFLGRNHLYLQKINWYYKIS